MNMQFALSLKAMTLAVVTVGAGALIVPQALADGTSPSTNGCYAQWNRTVARGICNPANRTGYYRLTATCDWEFGYIGSWRRISKGSRINPFDTNSCTFFATGASVQFTG